MSIDTHSLPKTELSDAEVTAAAIVGRAMLKGMRMTKLPRDAQIRAAIHAIITIGTMSEKPAHISDAQYWNTRAATTKIEKE